MNSIDGGTHNNSAGFTLIEIIISLAVISIALVTLMSVFNRTIAAAAQSATLTDAVMIAKEKIALIGSDGSDDTQKVKAGVSDWKDDERYPGYKYRKRVTETAFYGVELYTVEIEVQLGEKDIFTLTKYVNKG